MKKLKFLSYVFASVITFEGCVSASTKIIIIPENFPQNFPKNIGTPTLHIYLQNEVYGKIYILKRKDVIARSLEKPIKEAYVEFGMQNLQFSHCKIEGNGNMGDKTGILTVKYDENEPFSCILKF